MGPALALVELGPATTLVELGPAPSLVGIRSAPSLVEYLTGYSVYLTNTGTRGCGSDQLDLIKKSSNWVVTSEASSANEYQK